MDAELARQFFQQFQDDIERLWWERTCFRNFILDKNLMSDAELDSMVERAKADPDNRKVADGVFAPMRKSLAEFGTTWMLEQLKSNPSAKKDRS
jgi:hypothetical protein